MRRILGVSLFAVAAIAITAACYFDRSAPVVEAKEKSVLDFEVKNIDGADVKLKKYKGSVLMIVNTASKCGFTPQYEGLETIYQKYKDQGFTVLGFPANNFRGQEPGTDAEIKEFCELKYKVTFPMFSKVSVLGEDQHPMYKFLTSKETDPQFGGDISWNFNKFLIDRKGNIVARFTSKDAPQSEAVIAAIEKHLAEKK